MKSVVKVVAGALIIFGGSKIPVGSPYYIGVVIGIFVLALNFLIDSLWN